LDVRVKPLRSVQKTGIYTFSDRNRQRETIDLENVGKGVLQCGLADLERLCMILHCIAMGGLTPPKSDG
jgi:hypothetical protein